MTIDEETGRRPTIAERRQPPIFNVPGIVLATIVLFAAIHALRVYVIGEVADDRLILDFAFIPGCYGVDCVVPLRRSAGALFWSPLTHAFLHGDWTHLGLNTVWLLAFGSPVARRLGAPRFLAFSGLGAVAGAGLFYLVNPHLVEPVIGASGIVSALMGGACRFALSGLDGPAHRRAGLSDVPLLSIRQALANRTILFFIIVFFATNILTGVGAGAFLDGGANVAWEAHLGGFAFGFLFFAAFERRRATIDR